VSVCSFFVFMSGGAVLSILFGGIDCMCAVTISVCMRVMFSLMVSAVVFCGVVSMFVV